MLVRFICNNFLSFGKEFDFVNIATRDRKNDLDGHIAQENKNDFPILKGTAIYGANASGKSNFLNAIIKSSAFIYSGTGNKNLTYKDLNKFSNSGEMKFEYYIKCEDNIFNYGFIIEFIDKESYEISKEWLYKSSINKRRTRQVSLFYREKQNITNDLAISKIVKEEKKDDGFYEYSKKACAKNQLFLNRLKEDSIKYIKSIMKIFEVIAMDNLLSLEEEELVEKLSEDEELLFFYKTVIRIFDKNIEDVTIKPITINNFTSDNIFVKRKGKFFAWDAEESRGIKNLFMLMYELYRMGTSKVILLFDELESSLHPVVAKAFIKLFYELSKHSESQLIFTTHNLELMDTRLMNRDEIWITEKDENLNTTMKSLIQYDIRRDMVINKAYMENRFGGINLIDLGPGIKTLEEELII